MEPDISIIMPTYNCSEFLTDSIRSILNQSFDNFELIVVDDGSTDDTVDIARDFSLVDPRIRVLEQDHKYAGVARNLGLSHANGDFVIFLDGDDLFSQNLIKNMRQRILETNADVVVCKADFLNNKTGVITRANHTCNIRMCPPNGVFNRLTNPKYIFSFTSAAPWNKMYKRDYVLNKRLQFQNTRSANDLRFVMSSLAQADIIATLDQPLVTYRRNIDSSLQSTQGKDPFAFYRALTSLKEELQNVGVFAVLEHQFINLAFGNCMYNLFTLKTAEAQKTLFDFLRNEGFTDLGINGKDIEYFYDQPKDYIDTYKAVIKSKSYNAFHRKLLQLSN